MKPKTKSKKTESTQKTSSQLDYIRDSENHLHTEATKISMFLLYLIIALLVFACAWAYFAKIETFTIAQGKVVPASRIQVIQHLEGGIVKAINVKEGEVVKKGQFLMELDDTRFAAAYNSDSVKKAVLVAEVARLNAELEGLQQIKFPENFTKQHPNIASNAARIFKINKNALEEQLQVLKKSYQLSEKELKVIGPLADQGIMSKLDKLKLEKNLAAIQSQILEKQEQYRSTTRDALNKAKAELNVLNESITANKDRLLRTDIYSPVDGIVNKINVSTIGEVVDPGEQIMEIVPLDDKLSIKASIKASDIGFIKPGDKALIKVSAFDYARYGGLDAKLVSISADSFADKQGKNFYEVTLVTDKNYIGTNKDKLRIIPGMTVTVNIITGEKSILNYLLSPLQSVQQSALRER
ncbi:MAG: HlyD family type I secretion periplasmic adaptor subunit [Pseudomonadota bacterium]